MFGIDYLLSPYNFTDFFNDQLGKKAILIPGDDNKFKDLLSWEDIDYFQRYTPQGNNSTRLIFDKNPLANQAFSQFNKCIMEGATFVVNHLQTKHPNTDQFVRLLSAELNTRINVNCYVSKPNKQGFNTHYDRHDVFILHLHGEKAWTVFKPTFMQPIEEMKTPKGDPPDIDPYLECTMTPGDVLYIPRGHWHHAVSVTPSIHLTVGPQSRTPLDFLRHFLSKQMWVNEYIRTDFPIAEAGEFNGRRDDDVLKNYFSDFQNKMKNLFESEELFAEFQAFIMDSNPLSIRPETVFPDYQMIVENIEPTTEFTLPLGQKIILGYDNEKNVATVRVRGKLVILEDIDESILSATFHQGEIITGENILKNCEAIEWDAVKKYLLVLLEKDVICLA